MRSTYTSSRKCIENGLFSSGPISLLGTISTVDSNVDRNEHVFAVPYVGPVSGAFIGPPFSRIFLEGSEASLYSQDRASHQRRGGASVL